MSDASCRILVVFVDALGPAQLDRFDKHLDFLPYRRALRGILGYSSGALPTILTGAPPSIHGRMCLFSRNADDDGGVLAPLSVLGLLPRLIHERNIVRRLAASWIARHSEVTGYLALHRVPPRAFQWLDIPEREDIFQAEAIGAARTFLADARAAGLCVFTANWKLQEAKRWSDVFTKLPALQPDLTFLYSAELDAHLHKFGNTSRRVQPVITSIAHCIARTQDILTKDGRSLMTIVIGDHGMADVHRIIDPRPIAARINIEQSFIDSTMWRFWGPESTLMTTRKTVESSLIPGAWLDLRVLRSRGVPALGAPFAQALWLLPEGTIFAPSWVGGKARGMHGYDVGTQSSLAALASNDDAVSKCNALTDVAAVIRKRLGLGQPKNAGLG
ncbi:MAG TPA: alkaline phosphatase family protein [Polyangium sp.]|nr:alkaline phosphatase family protein [Polyangium sp.]